MIGTISSILLILIIFITEENLANPLRSNTSSKLLRSWRQSKSDKNQLIDAPLFTEVWDFILFLDSQFFLPLMHHAKSLFCNIAISCSTTFRQRRQPRNR